MTAVHSHGWVQFRHREPEAWKRDVQGPNTKYDPSVDHIRAFAAILIVLYHGTHNILGLGHFRTSNPLYAFILEGHTAVSLFMVLSGYIFTVSAIGKSIDYKRFMLNRFLRIYPLMLAVIGFAIVLHPEKFVLSDFLRNIFLFLKLPNALSFGPLLDIQPWTATLWTIVPEFQFYLIFPGLMFVLNRFGSKPLIVLLFFSVLAKVIFSMTKDPSYVAYWTLGGRIDQFLVGMLVAYWKIHERIHSKVVLGISICMALLGATIFNYLGGYEAKTWWQSVAPVIQGLVWGFFIASYMNVGRSIARSTSLVLTFVGTISFSIYLLHPAILELVGRIAKTVSLSMRLSGSFEHSAILTLIIGTPVVLMISAASFVLVERPFLNMRVRYFNERIADRSPSTAPAAV
ncbi:acyltransferase family protein [Bradyrhizobium guangdongense]